MAQAKFQCLNNNGASKIPVVVEESSFNSNPNYFQDGMPALKSPPSRRTKFTYKQKQYPNVKFQIGERTGKKTEPTDVSKAMRTAKDSNGGRLFRLWRFSHEPAN